MKIRKGFVFGLLFLALLILSACTISRGSGDIVTETRNVSGFDSVSLSGSGEVIIDQSGEASLTVETDDNIIDSITTEVRNGTLHLGTKDLTAVSPTRLIFRIGMDELRGLEISGSGEIRAEDIKTEQLEVDISGSGTIELSGEADRQKGDVSGSGKYDGGGLHSKTADVSVSGSGEITVWVTESLDAEVSGSGEINYYGDPTVNADTSGSGSVNRLGGR